MNNFRKKNLHLFLTTSVIESRMTKEVEYTTSNKIIHDAYVSALWDKGLPINDKIGNLNIIRQLTLTKKLQARGWFENTSIIRSIFAGFGFLEYQLKSIMTSLKIKPDFVSVHNLILLPISVIIAKLTSAKLVYVPHELETEQTGISEERKKYYKLLEKYFIRYCDSVVVVCEPIAEWYRDSYALKNVYVVRNVPRRADVAIRNIPNSDFRLRFNIRSESILFIYQGLIEKSRGIQTLLDAFHESDNNLLFMGYGSAVDDIISLNSPNVHYQETVPANQITSYTALADVGVFVINGDISLSYAMCLPNKFFEYMHAGIPIIVSDNLTYLAELVTINKLGWVVCPGGLKTKIESIKRIEIDELKEAIQKFSKNTIWENDAVNFNNVYKSS